MKSIGLGAGAVALAVAIVGMSWASNAFWDARGIVNQKGLSIEQRKAKAKRNQLEWDQRIQQDE
jgi:malic enzyme